MPKINFSLSERIANCLTIGSTLVSAIGLMRGKTGTAICLYNIYRQTSNTVYEDVADKMLDLIYEEINDRTPVNFSSGLAGVGCGIMYLFANNFVHADIDEVLEEVDESIFQLDRKKHKDLEDYSDFYGAGLYYLMRTKEKMPDWNEDAIRFLEYDLKHMQENLLLQKEHSEKEKNKDKEISVSCQISVLILLSLKKHLFSEELTDKITDLMKTKLNVENLNPVEKTVLGNLSIIEKPTDINTEITGMNDADFLKICSLCTIYGIFCPELVEEFWEILQNRFNSMINNETAQKTLFETGIGMEGLAGLFPFVRFENTTCLPQETKTPDSINLYVFNETSRAAVYGIGTYVNELVSALKNRDNININVVKLNDECSEVEIEIEDGARYWKIPASRYTTDNYEKQQTLYYQGIVRILKQYAGKPDKMIAHFNYMQSFSLLKEIKAIFECKTVLAIHYLNWCFTIQGNLSRLKNILKNRENDASGFEKGIRQSFEQEQKTLNEPDLVISLANHTAGILLEEYGIPCEKTLTVYNGLRDIARKITPAKRNRLKNKYRINPDENLIVFAGRLDPIKGLDILINAFAKVLKHKPESRLIVAGDGNFGEYLKKAENIWTKITFTGRIERNKLFEFYSIADIGVMPSTHEQCSYTAIEMMMHGLPIIVSTTTGLSEMVEENVSGMKVPVLEHEDKVEISDDLLAEKILYLLNNPQKIKEMRKQSRQKYEEYYSADIFGQNMFNLYRNLV